MSWIQYLMIFGALQGFVLALALISIKNPDRKVINLLFTFQVLSASVYLITNAFTQYFQDFPKLYLLSYLFAFCYTPLFHLFVSALQRDQFKLEKKHLLHAVPALIYLAFSARYLIMPKEEVITVMSSGNYRDLALSDFFALILNLYFIYQSWRLLTRNKGGVFDKSQLITLKLFSGLIVFSNLLWILIMLPRIGINTPFTINFGSVWIVTSFSIFFFTYFIVIRSELFTKSSKPGAYRNVKLDETESTSIEEKIRTVMRSDKPYLDPEFSLGDLSSMTGIDKFKLSMTINKSMNTSFFNLVNEYRLDEFIQLIESSQYENFSLLGIAQESGFKSKSTFYKAFKEVKGESPKAFLANKVA